MTTTVLIVDDDIAMGEMLCSGLRRHGFSVEARTSAVEALLALRGPIPDVIVTDIDMPGASGLELCRQVRATGCQAPVIVLSARGTFNAAIQALRAGASDFITKPCDFEVLVAAIARATQERTTVDSGPGPAAILHPSATLIDRTSLEDVEALGHGGRYARDLVHDLGTPLNVVLGHAQLLGSEEFTRAEVRTSARAIVAQAHRMTHLMRQMLDDDEARQARAITRLDQLVAAAVAQVEGAAQRRGVEIVVDGAAGAVTVAAHAHQLQQVVEHLLNISMQAMQGGRLRVRLDRSRAPLRDGVLGDSLNLSVEDSGCGMPPEHLEKIFRGLFTTTKHELGRVGLDLMVCHHVVRAHGGTIAIDSTPGRGSRFVVHLPLALARAERSSELVHT